MQPSRRYAIYALAVIFVANFLNYLDRTVVSTLEKPIRETFEMSGAEFGLLWTLFTVGYMCFAPFIGFFTDRYKRTRLLSICILVWSFATIGSGLAPTKGLLYVSRILIGVGEAGCLIIGPTLISDFFPREQRGRALSFFFLGLPLGGTAGYIIGGAFASHPHWRNAFYLAGLPGLLLSVVVWLLADPPRGAGEGAGQHGVKIQGIKPYFDLLRTPTLSLIVVAQACAVFFLVPLLHFGSGFFQEFRGMDSKEASITLGLMALIGGGIGSTLSGVLGDRFSRKHKGAYSIMAGVCFLLGLPCVLGGLYAAPKGLYLPLLLLVCFFYFMCMPAVNTQIANVTHPAQRAMAYALAVFVLHLLGDTMAPPVFGKVSDALARAHDPVEVNRVRLVIPGSSLAQGPVSRFCIQYKSYEPGSVGHSKAHGPEENWANATVRSTNAFALGASGWFSTRDSDMIFDIEPVRTTRIRYLQDVRGGPPAHPTQARVIEIQVFSGPRQWRPIRAEADSENPRAIIDGEVSESSPIWRSNDEEKTHFAAIVFGFPGVGRRLTFTFFSLSLFFAGISCLVAARFARGDVEKTATQVYRKEDEPPPDL